MRSHLFILAVISIAVTGCASGGSGLCLCSLFGGTVADAAAPTPAPAPAVEPAPLPPVAAPPPPEPSRRIVLRGVNFDFDSDRLQDPGRAILDAAIETLRENPGAKVRVGGHTDSIGSRDYNEDLSQRRASRVVEYLKSGGVAASQLVTIQGFGEGRPVADNSSTDGRAQNRRVELNLVE